MICVHFNSNYPFKDKYNTIMLIVFVFSLSLIMISPSEFKPPIENQEKCYMHYLL
ncbi:hypothetical protein KCTC52924_02912 [Arenibacter antarcticus]